MKIKIAVVIALLMAGATFWLGMRYAEGRQAVKLNKAVAAAIAQAESIWSQDRKILEDSHTVIREIEEVVRYVHITPVSTPECTDLGPDWIRLHNQAAAAAAGVRATATR